jgi:hypothetical protein
MIAAQHFGRPQNVADRDHQKVTIGFLLMEQADPSARKRLLGAGRGVDVKLLCPATS